MLEEREPQIKIDRGTKIFLKDIDQVKLSKESREK